MTTVPVTRVCPRPQAVDFSSTTSINWAPGMALAPFIIITGVPLSHFPRPIEALAPVKRAAARANLRLGVLDAERAEAIERACTEIVEGALHEHFVVDMIQGGAGTSTNMNANEVIANRALEILGHERGQYEHLHPNNHVNLGQSRCKRSRAAVKALGEMP